MTRWDRHPIEACQLALRNYVSTWVPATLLEEELDPRYLRRLIMTHRDECIWNTPWGQVAMWLIEEGLLVHREFGPPSNMRGPVKAYYFVVGRQAWDARMAAALVGGSAFDRG